MRGLRLKFMVKLYGWSSRLYAEVFKFHKQAWNISKEDFAKFSPGTLGFALGQFYETKGFDVMPKLENHDVFHVITQTDTEIADEIAMQYLLLGNGKVSLYLIGMVLVGGLIFPEYFPYYIRSFRKGQRFIKFHDVEFKQLLNYAVADLRTHFAQQPIFVTQKLLK